MAYAKQINVRLESKQSPARNKCNYQRRGTTRAKLVLGSESLSRNSKRAKLHTAAASNIRDNTPQSLYCLFVPHIYGYGCCSSCTSRSWWNAHSTQRQRSGCSSSTRMILSELNTILTLPSCKHTEGCRLRWNPTWNVQNFEPRSCLSDKCVSSGLVFC